jgi:hypothetical protein
LSTHEHISQRVAATEAGFTYSGITTSTQENHLLRASNESPILRKLKDINHHADANMGSDGANELGADPKHRLNSQHTLRPAAIRLGQHAMRPQIYAITATVILAASPTHSAPRSGQGIALGMTEPQVVRAMGRPAAIRLERNAVVCFGYPPAERGLLDRLQVLSFRSGILVSIDNSRSGLDRYCSRAAAAWDLPPLHTVTCFRKFWLKCP